MTESKPSRTRNAAKVSRCVLCGSTCDVEFHHVGGRHHIAWFTVPLCRDHHVRMTAALRLSGVEMSYTPNRLERLGRARKALWVFEWMLEEISSDKGEL